MKTLYLLRHAKASWKDADLDDVDRPLKKKGKAQADELSDHLSSLLPPPCGVWCSSAIRARDTLNYFLEVWPLPEDRLHVEKDLYLASAKKLFKRLREFPDEVEVAMLVGHNPGMTDLLHDLDRSAADDLSKVRTCEFVQLDFEVDRWADLKRGTGTMKLAIRSKDLPS